MSDKLSSKETKAELVRLIGEGKTIVSALEIVQKTRQTYEYYRKTDKEFLEAVERAKIAAGRAAGKLDPAVIPEFPEFCEKYLGLKLSFHQLQWWDVLEGRPPRGLHSSQIYIKGETGRNIINTPPGHAKSETVTVAWTIYQIIKDQENARIVIVSKTQTLAKKFLLRIKDILTSDRYKDLKADFSPNGNGWKEGSASWSATQFYLGNRNVESKDPTVQAIGIRAQLYGTRATMIILDDCIDNTNHQQFEDQREWVQEIVSSRLSKDGQILVIGTRIATRDLYSELQDGEYYFNGVSPYTYLVQPAVLEFDDDPENWLTLWPKSNIPWDANEEPDEEGLYPRWGGKELNNIRNRMTPSGWSRIYMQQQIAEDNVFKDNMIKNCISGRSAGLIPDNSIAGRTGGMTGLYVLAGLDPATSGNTAITVMGVDIVTGKRYIIDIWNKAGATNEITPKIKELTLKYKVREWRIENNGFQGFLADNLDLKAWLANNGAILVSHHTGNNKNDADFGVMSLSALFETNLIDIPSPRDNDNIKDLITQLINWKPNMSNAEKKRNKTDIVMSLWFAELRAKELILREEAQHSFRDSKWTTRKDRMNRVIIGANINTNPYDLSNYRFGRNK
jgi:hypothetical protein